MKPRDLLEEKRTSQSAESLFEEHLKEVLGRVGGGGVPIDANLIELIEPIKRYCVGLDTYSGVYSMREPLVSERSARLAIRNLDTKTAFVSIYKSVYELFRNL